MNMGFGISEFLLIALLVLIFFGSRELPEFIRLAARWLAVLRKYSVQIQTEFEQLAAPANAHYVNEGDPVVDKKALRALFEKKRVAISEDDRQRLSSAIAKRVVGLPDYQKAGTVLLYASQPPEVDTGELIRSALADGKTVLLPRCTVADTTISIYRIQNPAEDLAPGAYGLMEPIPGRCQLYSVQDVDLIVCPGVAFDRAGNRLGRGAAYYDRFLAERDESAVSLVGICFACQLTDATLPVDGHDVKMGTVVCESEVAVIES